MLILNARIQDCFFTLASLISSPLLRGQTGSSSSGWKAVLQNRIPLYGHRNWIVIADAAFPVYAAPGIETIVINGDLLSTLKCVATAISSSGHVRASVFLDQELQFVDEQDYPGVSELRSRVAAVFDRSQASSIPHSEVMQHIDDAGKTFRILFMKTTERIPYSSVYIRLDCGYMSDEVERKITAAMTSGTPQ